jgi:hypothetical protein
MDQFLCPCITHVIHCAQFCMPIAYSLFSYWTCPHLSGKAGKSTPGCRACFASMYTSDPADESHRRSWRWWDAFQITQDLQQQQPVVELRGDTFMRFNLLAALINNRSRHAIVGNNRQDLCAPEVPRPHLVFPRPLMKSRLSA